MTTFPAGWRDRAEMLRHAARQFSTTVSADARDLWTRVARGSASGASSVAGPETPAHADTAVEEAHPLGTPRKPAPASTTAAAAPAGAAASGPRKSAAFGTREASAATVLAQRGDDLATVLGRIEASGEPEVVLVVPRGVASLRTAAAWARLAGHARRRGLTLRVVAARAEVRGYARRTGLEAARTRRGLRGSRAPLTLGDFAFPLTLPRLRDSVGPQATVLLGVLLAGVIAFAYMGPLARIEVSPVSTPIEESVRVRIDPIATRFAVGGRSLPATTVQRSVRVIVSAPTTGSAPVGDRPAGVRLEFRNDGDTAIEVPARTTARSDQHDGFATTERVMVPAGQRVAVDAIAVQPGTMGNVAPGTVHLLDGLPTTLSVNNPAAARGGADRLVPGVAQADVDRVRALADDVLAQAAVHEARQAYEGGLVLRDSVSVAILGQTPFQRLEEPAEIFVAEYVAQASVLVVLPETATRFAEAYLRSILPAERDLVPGVTRVDFQGAPILEGGQMHAQVALSGRTAARLDERALARTVAGATPREASERLREQLRLDAAPRVRISPPWLPWPWLPRRADRIEVALGPPDPATPRPAE